LFIRDPDPDFLPILYPGSRGQKRHQIPDPGVKKAQDPGSGSATLSEACGTDLRREWPLEGVAGLGRPAAGVNIRTVVVHPLVQLLAEPVVVQLDLTALNKHRFKHRKKGKKTKKRQQISNPSADPMKLKIRIRIRNLINFQMTCQEM
jgi:hypothetical protein